MLDISRNTDVNIDLNKATLTNNQEVIVAKKQNGYRIFVSRVGYREFSIHNSLEYIYVIKGKIKLKLENKIVVLNEDDLIFIGSNIPHIIDYMEEDNIALVLQIHPDEFEDAERLKGLKSRLILEKQEKEDFKLAMSMLYRESLGASIEDDLLKDYWDKLVSSDLDEGRFLKEPEEMSIDKIVIKITKDLQNLISNTGDTRLDSLAKKYNISYSHLSRKFKEIIGENYRDYLLKLRLNYAVNLLINTDDLITNVAIDAGFKSIKNFNRSFKDYFNIPPSDFRKKYDSESKVFYDDELYKDPKTQEFLKRTSVLERNRYRHLNIGLKDDSILKNHRWRKVIDLYSIMDLESGITNLKEILSNYKSSSISIRLIYQDGKFHLLSASGKVIFLESKDREELVKALDSNNIRPVIQLAFPLQEGSITKDLQRDKIEKYLEKIIKYRNYILENVKEQNLREWKIELYVRNIERIVSSEDELKYYNYFLESFIKNAVDGLELPYENIGIYIGKVHIFNNNDFIDKLKDLNLDKYPGIFFRLDVLCDANEKDYKRSYEFLEREINRIRDSINLRDSDKVVITFNYVDGFSSKSKRYKSYYYSVLYLRIYLDLVKLGVNVSSINIIDRKNHKIKDYAVENTPAGIKRTVYYISKLIEGLESDIIHLKNGVMVTKDQNSISILMLPKIMTESELALNENKDIFKIQIEDINGEYKETRYELLQDITLVEDKMIGLTESEYFYYQTMNMPKFKVDFRDINKEYNLDIKKNQHTIKLIKLTRVKS